MAHGQGLREYVFFQLAIAKTFQHFLSQIPRKRLGQALQFDMDLECNIEAYPAPAITWYRNKIQLKNNQHYSLSHFPFDDEYTNTILRVITIEKKQVGLMLIGYVVKLAVWALITWSQLESYTIELS